LEEVEVHQLSRIVLAILTICGAQAAAAQTTTAPSASVPSGPSAKAEPARRAPVLNTDRNPWIGDFDRMFERRVIRVAAPYSRSLYYSDKGRERGLAGQLVRDFERYVNAKYKKKLGRRPLTVYLFPVTRDQLLPDVASGLADIAVGNLTVTEDRLNVADMVAPDVAPRIQEILVTGPTSPDFPDIEALSGATVHVRRASSYYESLSALNERLRRGERASVNIVLVPDSLEDEDMMEMLNAGLLQAIVVDDWKARLWAPVLPKLKLRTDIVFRDGGRPGWAIRKDSPLLAAELNDFFVNWVKKNGVITYRLQQDLKRVKQIEDPTGGGERARFDQMLTLFERYGARYHFDPLMLIAQGYQESQLNQGARSQVGALGVMQLMPATGASMKVGDITQLESNIHAGTKYMNTLMTRYFADAQFSEMDRTLIAFASYNCGPGNVAKARGEAQKRGLDPNVWFNNLEIVIAHRIGIETTKNVRNVYKYYAPYKMIVDAERQSKQAREALSPQKH
jgi:membrane-bound lytic murein transglycosylase MltF